jgi:hypothetical protein
VAGVTDQRPRTTDHRLQTTDNRQQTTDHRSRTTDHGPRTTDYRPQTTDHGPQTKFRLKGVDTTAQGNALGIPHRRLEALKGRDKTTFPVSNSPIPSQRRGNRSAALTGLWRARRLFPGRCPGLYYCGLSGWSLPLTKGWKMATSGAFRFQLSSLNPCFACDFYFLLSALFLLWSAVRRWKIEDRRLEKSV